MNTSKELIQKREALNDELLSLQARIDDKTLDEAGEKRIDTVIDEIKKLNEDVATAEKREAAIEAARSAQRVNMVINPTKADNEQQAKESFRFTTLINTLANNKPVEGFMKEMHEQGQRDMSAAGIQSSEGFVVPAMIIGAKRDMAAVTNDTSKAGYTIATDLLSNEWIDVLRNSLVFSGSGVRFMSGLQGNVAIPKKTNDSGANWLTETGSITPADAVFNQVTMSPKRLGNATAFSLKLLAQSSMDIESIVRQDLITSQALALEAAAIKGPIGGNGPIGILNTSGIGSVTIGTNGGALTWAKLVELETAVANNNALINNLMYLTNSKVRGAAKGISKDTGSGQFLWENGALPLNGYGAMVTNAVPSTNVKGSSGAVCSSLIFGNWADLMIGQWGGMVLTVNPYALDLSGQVRVTINSYYDVAARNAESFATLNDLTT